MDLREKRSELGFQSSQVPHYRDSEAKTYRSHRIDDVELAHDMALAMDPVMERVIEQREFLAQLTEDPDAIYRRAGKKAIIFSNLIEEQKTLDDKNGEITSNYQAALTVDEYLHKAVSSYIFKKEGRSTYYTPRVSKKEAHVTNGFVATFQEKALKRAEGAANKAGALVYYKQKTRENIALYEQLLSKRDQAVFHRIEPREEDRIHVEWSEGDEEAVELGNRAAELGDIFRRKHIVEMIGKTFGRKSTRGFTREDFLRLAGIVGEEYYTLKS